MTNVEPAVVLLVDDEEEFVHATSRLLARRGFAMRTAGSGEDALALLARERVDAVVLDLKMPGMGGEATFARLRRDHPGLPVIILTGHGSLPQAFQMSREGVWDFLAKPCDPERLAAMLAAATTRRPAVEAGATAPASGPPRVLLVDDEVELLEGLQRVLARRELEVSRAGSGEEALAALGREDVDVVVLDLKMPGLSGLDTLREIRRRFPDRVVVVLTGHLSDPEAMRCRELGATEVLAKPPDVPALSDLLKRSAASRRALRAELERQRLADILERQAD